MGGGMLLDKSRVQLADSAEGKRILRQKGGVREGLTTSLLSPPLTEGVHTIDLLITSCKDEPGGIFLGLADRESSLSTALGDRNCGWGWGSRMPYVRWVDRIKDGWIQSKQYPYYKTQTDQWVGFRHDMYSYDAKQVQDLLVEWKLKSHLKAFAREGIDGGQLEVLDRKKMEQDLGIRAPHDRDKLAQRISELFEEKLSFRQGDLVRMRFDADKGELELLKSPFPLPQEWDEAKWEPVGTPVTGLKGRDLCFGATIFHDKDVLEWRIGGPPPPAPPKGPEYFSSAPTGPGGVFPELSMWQYAQGKGDGEHAKDDFTVIRHSLFGTTIELEHKGEGSIALVSSDRLEGVNLYHVLTVLPSCESVCSSQWRAPSVVGRVKRGGYCLYGKQEGIEWSTLGGIGGARAVEGMSIIGSWFFNLDQGSTDAWRPEDLVLGTDVLDCVHRESGTRMTLTASAVVIMSTTAAVVCQRGAALQSASLEEARLVRVVDDAGPTKQEEVVRWKGETDVVPKCPSSAAVSHALMHGERQRVVPIPWNSGGDDPMTNYNYAAQRTWQEAAMRREKVAAKSGRTVMSHTDVERRLERGRWDLGRAEHAVQARERALQKEPGMTGHGVRRDRERADRLARALSGREADHLGHEESVRAQARARFPVKRLHGPKPPGQKPWGAGEERRPVSSLRSRDQSWMMRVGRPGGSAGALRDPWGQPRWDIGGEWLNLHPPIDRFKPAGG